MNIYCLCSYDGYQLFTHERKMDSEELRALLLQHIAPLAELEAALLAEGEEKFGKGFLRRWSISDPAAADAKAFENWKERCSAATDDVVGVITRAAGLRTLEPVEIFCPDYRDTPLHIRKALEEKP